jgi:molybdopterin-guanine dinucleotide biosynthesis protein A
MAAQAAELLAPVCAVVVISANRNLARYASWADVVTTDGHADYLGPLAGISAGLAAVPTRFLLTCPCDATRVPPELPGRLLRTLRRHGSADVAVLRDPQRLQPLLMALRGSAGPAIDNYLARGGRSVHGWLATVAVVEVTTRSVIGNRNLTVAPVISARED